ncbi:XdhC family protein [Streptomyces sp. NPDC021080]|uniref:XdhC family protein n=1 Tax=Streptomyces sp. NPDC021080 TaxID=3365110 RepID=UPI0037AAD74C
MWPHPDPDPECSEPAPDAVTPASPVSEGPAPSPPGSTAADSSTPGPFDPADLDGSVLCPPVSAGPAPSSPGSPGSTGLDGSALGPPDPAYPAGSVIGPPVSADPAGSVLGPPGSVGMDGPPSGSLAPTEPDGEEAGPSGSASPAGSDCGVSGAAEPGRGVLGSLGSAGLDDAVAADVRDGAAQGGTGLRHYGPHGERCGDVVTVFLHSFAPPPRMLVFGAVDHAAAVARVGGFLGYRVTVCDARPAFATPRRFPAGVEVVVDWPHRYLSGQATDERTVICVLTHDPKFDVPLLEEALRRPAAYVGAMGSRRTHDHRLERLRAAGVPERALSRLRSPVGLDLGARTPEEVAVSVAAEIVALRRGGSGVPLTARTGSIHPR